MKALIIKSSSLGDIVHSLPAVAAFKAARPEAEIDWLIEDRWADVLRDHPLIDRLWIIDTHALRHKDGFLGSYGRLIGLIRQMRQTRYDIAVDLQRLTKSAALMATVRAGRRYGFAWNSTREWPAALMVSRRAKVSYQTDQIRDQYLALMSLAAGRRLSLPQPPYLAASDKARRELVAQWPDRPTEPYAVVLTGGAFGTKLWPVDHWREIILRLTDRLPVVLPWAGAAERDLATRAADGLAGALTPPPLSLPQLMALLEPARLVVGGDTGPLHLSAALNRPTVSFYGPTLARRNAPPGHATVQSPVECTGCVKRTCPKGQPDCLTAVTPDRLWAEVEPLI